MITSAVGYFTVIPRFFLADVFLPVRNLPWYLDILSKLVPMRYTVDLVRSIFYMGRSEYAQVVLLNPFINLLVIGILFVLFLSIETTVFVRSERNR
ncbi:MAG TPA: hypothetical protein VL485_04700 [Ktedonobacteraceae bacterium]|nr:hypothetical protein [Ktedonobacteraceae bacterium]